MSEIYGLTFGCPFGDERDECPFREIRKVNDFENRLEIIENMTQEQKFELVNQHKMCSLQRQNELKMLSANGNQQKK